MKKIFQTLALVTFAALAGPVCVADQFAVIVNAENAGDEQEIKNLFLKRKTSWNNGEIAVPLAREDASVEQAAFNATVLGLSASELAGHWQTEKQKTGETPPKAVGSERILFRQIQRKKGAFGIVPVSSIEIPPDGIRVLYTFEN